MHFRELTIATTLVAFPLMANAQCTALQINDIDVRMGEAGAIVQRALNDLPANAGASAPNYTTYYGAYDAGRVSTVSFVLSQVLATMTVAQRSYICVPNTDAGCTGSTLSYVTPSKPYEITFCARYFTADAINQQTNLVHEITHFDVNGGADSGVADHHCKTDADCQSLAQNSPDLAVDSAYSHQLYVMQY